MSTILTIQSTDLITNSRGTINTNFSNLNTDKIETSVLDTDTTLAANSDAKVATQKAIKAYTDAVSGRLASTTVSGFVEEATQTEIDAKTAVGATGARLFINPSAFAVKLPTIQVFTASGTWTKPSGITGAIVEVVGAGGGSGGAVGSALPTPNASAGGGGGGYSRKVILTASLGATETVTIGAAGAAGSATPGAGGNGGTTSFGSHLSATGGTGSGVGAANVQAGTGGVGSSGTVNIKGSPGGNGFSPGTNLSTYGGHGGDSLLGGGGVGGIAGIAGTAGGNYGAGGGGTYSANSTAVAGLAGATGVIIVTEFY